MVRLRKSVFHLVLLFVLAAFMAGCVSVTPQGVLFYINPIVDYRVPAPEAVEVLEEIAEEENIPVSEACIDLNTADTGTLQLLIHIGPVRAEAISGLRERMVFESPEDLRLVGGISDYRLGQILAQGLVCGS